MISACVFLMLSYLYTTFYGIFKLPTFWAVSIYVLLNIYPTAVLGLLPMAMAGDMAQADAQKTGIYKNASYYGMKTFMMKMGIALTSLIFPSLLLLGNTPDNSTGIRLVAFVSVITSVLSVILLMKYKDPFIMMNDK
jgi:GPH family glycoside/pentoside/hexuronide:cation symporter